MNRNKVLFRNCPFFRNYFAIFRNYFAIFRSYFAIFRNYFAIFRKLTLECIPQNFYNVAANLHEGALGGWVVGGWVGCWDIDVPCDGYGIYMLVFRSAESFSSRFDVALRLFVVSEH